MLTTAGSTRLLAFFGADIVRAGVLTQAVRDGFVLLALDVPAIGRALDARVPCSVIEEWVEPAAREEALVVGTRCSRGWYTSLRSEFTVDGLCWPEFDRHAMHWFWNDVALADAAVTAFQERGVREVAFLRSGQARQQLYYFPSDTCPTYWTSTLPLGGIAAGPAGLALQLGAGGLSLLRPPVARAGRGLRRLLARYTDSAGSRARQQKNIAGSVAVACNHSELPRFAASIAELSAELPGRVTVITLTHDPAPAQALAKRWNFAVLPGPQPVVTDPALGSHFLRGCSATLAAAAGQPWQRPLAVLPGHFNHYCSRRWPALVAGLRAWTTLWRRARPAAVLVSSLADAESQLPAAAARLAGIPTFSLPHGGVQSTNDLPSIDHILCTAKTQEAAWLRGGIPAARLAACRSLLGEPTGRPAVTGTPPGGSSWRILALTQSVGAKGCLTPTISIPAQREALRALDTPPPDLEERLSLRIKVHPWADDLALYSSIGPRLAGRILPLDTPLQEALEEADLVLAVNYYGTALMYALRQGKGVLHFWTDPLFGHDRHFAQAAIFLPAGRLVRTGEELWTAARDFFLNPVGAAELRARARDFSDEMLDDRSYPSLAQVLLSVGGVG